MDTMAMHHYTDRSGYNSLRSSVGWCFRAHQAPGDHPFGSYFTTLGPVTKNLALRLRISRSKIEYVFAFRDAGDLQPLRGQRGDYIFYSTAD
jgi:hypothetical protein